MENREYIIPTHPENILKTIKLIEEDDNKNFDMCKVLQTCSGSEVWSETQVCQIVDIHDDKSFHFCNGPACIAGWARISQINDSLKENINLYSELLIAPDSLGEWGRWTGVIADYFGVEGRLANLIYNADFKSDEYPKGGSWDVNSHDAIKFLYALMNNKAYENFADQDSGWGIENSSFLDFDE